MAEESHEQTAEPVECPTESTGNAELDEQLAQPVLKGNVGLDQAMAWAAGFLVVLAGLIVFSGVLNIPFHAIDRELFGNGGAPPPTARWTEAIRPGAPEPLTLFSLAVNRTLTGGSSAGIRAVNLLLHLLNGVLVYLVCRRVFERRLPEAVAMLSGLFFVLHPVNVEAVASLAGRAQLLGAFCALTSVLLFVSATGDRATPRWGMLGLALLAYACAFGACRGAWCVPLLVVVVDVLVRGPGFSGRRVGPLVCYFAVLAVLLVGVWAGAPGQETLPEELGSAVIGAGDAALRAVWPVGLRVAPSLPASMVLPGAVFALVVIVATGGAAAAALRGSVPGAAFAWFGIALVAVATVGDAANAVADRALYLPLAGLVWVVPWAFSRLPRTPGIRTACGLACAGLLLVSGIAAFVRVTTWQNEIALWRDAVRRAPGETAPAERLGMAYLTTASRQLADAAVLEESGYDSSASEIRGDAEEHFRQGREILSALPEDRLSAESLYHLGMAHRRLGDQDAALKALLASLRMDDTNQGCALEAAQVLQARNAAAADRTVLLRSLEYYEYARGLGELPPEILPAYGAALAQAGRLEEAAQAFSAALENAQDAPGWMSEQLNEVQGVTQRLRLLEEQEREWEVSQPGSEAAQLLRVQSLLIQNRPLRAAYLLDEVMRREGGSSAAMAWIFLGYVRAWMGQDEAFLSEWPVPPVPDREQAEQWTQLASMCVGRGDWAAAERYLLSPAAGMAGVRMPLVALGAASLRLRDAKRAHDYLTRATEEYPGESAPWLALCDLAMAQNNALAARQYLAEAEKRNAPQEELSQRRQKLGDDAPAVPTQPGEVVIR